MGAASVAARRLAAGVACIGWAALMTTASAQGERRSATGGVYTSDQATRGEAVFARECITCHDSPGGAAAVPLAGADFIARWRALSIGDLLERIRLTMPETAPGTLSAQRSADLVAYILRTNSFPSGPTELGGDSAVLKQILFGSPRP